MGVKKILVHKTQGTDPSNKTALFRFHRENFAKSWKTLRFYLTLRTRI